MAGQVVYHTIAEVGEGFYKEKGSKFFAHAFPVKNEVDVKKCLDMLRKQYHDARHHCYAFHLGLKQPTVRANDDGEPNHSAGDPILGQIRSFNLTNVLVVVVRYFGGTKLGVGGLIHAYKTAAYDALEGLQIQEVYESIRFQIDYRYEETPTVERLVSQFELTDVERRYEVTCQIAGNLRLSNKEEFEALSKDLQLVIRWLDQSS